MSKTPRRRPLSPENLGAKGEIHFKGLCINADLIANKSEVDLMGWDYLVECPYPDPDTATPLDKRSHPVACKVQVKTVWDDTNHVALTLSAAERFAKAGLPSFIVVLSVDAKLDCVAMHVFHMLDQHLEHVLKRLRKATAENSLKINHTEISFSLRRGVSIGLDGASLRRFIMDACGDSTTAYHHKKQDQLANLGFGQLRYDGKFTLKVKSESEIAELFLGLRTAEAVSFEANEIRFGIKLPDYSAGGGIIKITPHPASECKIIAKGRDGGPSVSIPGTLYLPPQRNQNGDIPYRISTALLEIFVNGRNLRIDNKVSTFMTTPVVTKELLATLKFHSVVFRGGGRFTVLAKNKQIVDSEINSPVDQEAFDATNSRIRLVEMVAAVFKAADAQSRAVSLSSMADKSAEIIFLNDLINNEGNVTINSMTFKSKEGVDFPKISEALLIRRFCFPDFAVAYYAIMDVALTECPPCIVLDVRSVSLRDVTVIDGGDDFFDAYVEEARLTTGLTMSVVMHSASETVTGQGAIGR